MTVKLFGASVAMGVLLAACATNGTPSTVKVVARDAAIIAAINSPDRPAKDREQDAKRKPADVMHLSGVMPGQKVIDMFSAGGWYAELLSRVVGPKGQVYAQNPPVVLQRFGDKAIKERLADNRLPNVVRWDKPLNDMELPANYFDGAMINLVLHDFYWITQDVDDVLADLRKSLKKGAWIVVVDHAAPAGTRDSFAKDVKGQHRIDEDFAKERLAHAGFVLVDESMIERNAADDRTQAFFSPAMQGKETDKFILRYRNP